MRLDTSETASTREFFAAEDGIRTRDPHLGKMFEFVQGVWASPVNWSPVYGFSTEFDPVVERSTTRSESTGILRSAVQTRCSVCLGGGISSKEAWRASASSRMSPDVWRREVGRSTLHGVQVPGQRGCSPPR